jgi:hypothetical protein
LQWAVSQGCRELFAWDADFVEWPWSEAPVLEALTAWAQRGRTLHLLALDYEDLQRRHPRFVRWRRDFGHCVVAKAADPELRPDAGPQSLLVMRAATAGRCLRLFDKGLWRGEVSEEPAERLLAMEWFDAMTQRSSDAFPATTLGL